MSCTEKAVFAPKVSPELDGELQRLMKQSGLAAPDLLHCMVGFSNAQAAKSAWATGLLNGDTC